MRVSPRHRHWFTGSRRNGGNDGMRVPRCPRPHSKPPAHGPQPGAAGSFTLLSFFGTQIKRNFHGPDGARAWNLIATFTSPFRRSTYIPVVRARLGAESSGGAR